MPTLEIRTPEGITLRRELAGPGSRYAAICIDAVLVVLMFLLILILGAILQSIDPTGIGDLLMGIAIGGGVLAVPGYFWISGLYMEGQTVGKLALGLRVVSANGYPASSWQLLLRSLMLFVDMFPYVLVYAGFLLAMVSERRQRVGDMVAGTIVVRDPKNQLESEPFAKARYSELGDRSIEFAASVASKLGKDDLEFLRSLLSRRGLEEEKRRSLFVRAGRHYQAKLGLESFEDARYFLRDLFLFLREAREARV